MLKNMILCFVVSVIMIANVLPLDVVPNFLKSDVFNIHRHIAVQTRNIKHTPVAPENVTFYLFTKEKPKEAIQIFPDNVTALSGTGRKIVFIIHGWQSSREADWYEKLTIAFLTIYGDQYSVVQVDWKDPANQFYYVSSINTYDVAKIITSLLTKLKKDHSIPFENILLVGHSLGGQICGFVGKLIQKETGMKIPRIIALDPAGPLFDTRPEDKRLNKNDADIVEVIHSDGGTFGFLKACGTIDFFPNGGSSQPGCKRIDLLDITSVVEPVSCDHLRVTEYFVEAILNPDHLIASKCESWKQYFLNQCTGETVPLGDLSTNKTGNFYFETNRDRPYSKTGKNAIGIGLGKVLSILPGSTRKILF